eukprot:4015314-Karenia_brevis.AAC.1
MDSMPALNMSMPDAEGAKAVASNPNTMLITHEYDKLRQLHVQGAAAEFILHKVWDLLQYIALAHRGLGAQAQQASDNIDMLIEKLGQEINVQARLPHGMEKAKQNRMVWTEWLKPQMEQIRYAQE